MNYETVAAWGAGIIVGSIVGSVVATIMERRKNAHAVAHLAELGRWKSIHERILSKIATSIDPIGPIDVKDILPCIISDREQCEVSMKEMMRAITNIIWGFDSTELLTVGAYGSDMQRVWERLKAERDAAIADNARLREALEAIIRRVALVSPYYEMARAALTPAIANSKPGDQSDAA